MASRRGEVVIVISKCSGYITVLLQNVVAAVLLSNGHWLTVTLLAGAIVFLFVVVRKPNM